MKNAELYLETWKKDFKVNSYCKTIQCTPV